VVKISKKIADYLNKGMDGTRDTNEKDEEKRALL
jgi:hypothetical protein